MFNKKIHLLIMVFMVLVFGLAGIFLFPRKAVTQVAPNVVPVSLTAAQTFKNPPDIIKAVYFTGWSAG
ncbi:hypothetical protein EPO66_04765, partial [bacterium]